MPKKSQIELACERLETQIEQMQMQTELWQRAIDMLRSQAADRVNAAVKRKADKAAEGTV